MKSIPKKTEETFISNNQNNDLENDSPFPIISREEFAKISKNLRTLSDVTAFTKALVAPTIQAMLEAEMENHLGYKKHSPAGDNTGNNRNGYYPKTIITSETGKATIQVPRDRKGEFEPLVIRKYETIESGVEEKIVSMYAKGMTTRDIKSHMNDIYSVDISAEMVSNITDKVLPLVKEWETRPLEKIYPIVFLDAIHYKVRDSGKIVSKAAYNILGINLEGKKELLGIWIGENEGAKYWLGVLNELKNRGVEDILILAMDGLMGLPEAAKIAFPKTQIQLCIIHQIRNTLKYVSHKEKKKFMDDLKTVYKASTEKLALENLEEMKKKWPHYKFALKSWETKWPELSTFYKFPEEVRKVIYTTNAIEGLHRQFRKVTKTTSIFPHNESLMKLLWLAQKDITKKWTMSIDNWGMIIGQLSLMHTDRIEL
jgi:transposase-like protein